MGVTRRGVVYLVGAGPGRPGADDGALAGADRGGRLDLLRPADPAGGARRRPGDAELIYVGKQPGCPSVPQEEIGERLIEAARAGTQRRAAEGRRPVRLRPRRRGGRSAARGGGRVRGRPRRHRRASPPTAYAGIPVTHRDDASAVAFVTGHEDPEKAETALDWDGARRLPRHARLLHGRQTARRERRGADRRRPRSRASPRRRSNAGHGRASGP